MLAAFYPYFYFLITFEASHVNSMQVIENINEIAAKCQFKMIDDKVNVKLIHKSVQTLLYSYFFFPNYSVNESDELNFINHWSEVRDKKDIF